MTAIASIFGDPASALLWCELLLLWTVTHYFGDAHLVPELLPSGERKQVSLRENRPWIVGLGIRASAAAFIAFAITGWGSWTLAIVVISFSVGLPLLRAKLSPGKIPEFELGVLLIYVFVLAQVIRVKRLTLAWSVAAFPLSSTQLQICCLIGAILLFVVRGGTLVVRGILDKTGTLPLVSKAGGDSQAKQPQSPPPTTSGSASLGRVDIAEYSRGRLIGNLERVMLVVVVAAGSYEALAFLVAAKGLIRSKDLEDRAWAEYFLVGSMASVLVALGAGLVVQMLLRSW